MSFVIADVIQHGADVKEFHIRRVDGLILPKWLAGSHIVLRFSSADGRAFENRYSLIGEPGETDTYRIAVQREEAGRGGSRCMHDEMGVGSGIDVDGPFNSFPLLAAAATAAAAPASAAPATTAAPATAPATAGVPAMAAAPATVTAAPATAPATAPAATAAPATAPAIAGVPAMAAAPTAVAAQTMAAAPATATAAPAAGRAGTAAWPRVLLVAGGIGITPMVSMAYALSAQGRPFELHYLARKPERFVLLDELRSIPGASIKLHASQDAGRADLPALLGAWYAGDVLYACGPATLLQGLADAGAEQGWPPAAMRFESFGARAQEGDEPLTVELTLSQMTVEVQPGTSILDALIAADVFVSYDCKRGECGSCYTQVLEGQPRHRDVCLTPVMREQGMCTCVSWAAPGRLVLEL